MNRFSPVLLAMSLTATLAGCISFRHEAKTTLLPDGKVERNLDEVRDRIAPINKRFPLRVLIEACKALPIARRRRITFEYVMLDGVNDSPDDARRLVKMLTPLRAKVNLIFFNPFPESGFVPSSRERVEDFQAILHKGNLTATIRESRGRDIAAACGQLFAERNPAGTSPH